MSELTMPGGNPDLLEQLAARVEAAASRSADLGISTRQVTASIRSGASWTGDAADAYTVFTGNLSQGAAATEAPLSRIASAVREYAVQVTCLVTGRPRNSNNWNLIWRGVSRRGRTSRLLKEKIPLIG